MIFKLKKNQPLSKYSDEQLIVKFQETGISEFAGELYNRYVHLVYGICLKYIKHKEESKDIAMEVFEKMLAHLPSSDIQSFKKWLYTISRNLCLNYLRNQNKKAEQTREWQLFEKKSKKIMENEDFLCLNNEGQEEQLIHHALKQLKPDQRKCLELFFFEGMSYNEIEQKTEYSIKQVKSLLQNGKRNLRILLESTQIGATK